MTKTGKRARDDGEGRGNNLLNEAAIAALMKDGLTIQLADALDTIVAALRAKVASGTIVPEPPPRRHRPVTIRSRSRGLNLTLVINARKEKE